MPLTSTPAAGTITVIASISRHDLRGLRLDRRDDYDEACPTTSSEGVGIKSPVVEAAKARKTNVNGSPKRWRTYSKESPENKCFNFFGLQRGFVGGRPGSNPIQ